MGMSMWEKSKNSTPEIGGTKVIMLMGKSFWRKRKWGLIRLCQILLTVQDDENWGFYRVVTRCLTPRQEQVWHLGWGQSGVLWASGGWWAEDSGSWQLSWDCLLGNKIELRLNNRVDWRFLGGGFVFCFVLVCFSVGENCTGTKANIKEK